MNIYAFIPTRDAEISESKLLLERYLSDCGAKVIFIANQESIFEAHKKAYDKVNPDPEDIIILCHDDILILSDKQAFQDFLGNVSNEKIGFIGVAGTTRLESDAVWWDHTRWGKGMHRGFIFHGNNLQNAQPTHFGPHGSVAVLDGVFLACKAKTLAKYGMKKPPYFDGNWDFYDLHYTAAAFEDGLVNCTVPILIMHASIGNLAGRDSWHKNKAQFIKMHTFPIVCK